MVGAPLGPARGSQVDGEAITLSVVVKLSIADGHLHGLVLCEIRRLEFVLLLVRALLVLLVVVEVGAALPVEEVHDA